MKTLEIGSFPIAKDEFAADLKELMVQIKARYSSRVTIVALLPQAIWAAKKLEEFADEIKAQIHLVGLGLIPTEKDGKKNYMIVEPPSHYSIFGKKVVIIGVSEPWDTLLAAGLFIRDMRPQSIEIGSILARGEKPEWLNPDYVVYQVPEDLLVTGLGLGYDESAAGGAALTVEVVTVAPVTQEESNDGERS